MPANWIPVIGSSSITAPRNNVDTGPTMPACEVVPAPMRATAIIVMKTGSTVQKKALNIDSQYTGSGWINSDAGRNQEPMPPNKIQNTPRVKSLRLRIVGAVAWSAERRVGRYHDVHVRLTGRDAPRLHQGASDPGEGIGRGQRGSHGVGLWQQIPVK